MNASFCDIGSTLSSEIKQLDEMNLDLPERNTIAMFIQPTKKLEILNIINTLKNRSAGINAVDSKTLKTMFGFIVTPPQHDVFNFAINKSIWLDALKSSKVVPIFKAGDRSKISNYRPIFLISNIIKVSKKIMYNRSCYFLPKCHIILVADN